MPGKINDNNIILNPILSKITKVITTEVTGENPICVHILTKRILAELRLQGLEQNAPRQWNKV